MVVEGGHPLGGDISDGVSSAGLAEKEQLGSSRRTGLHKESNLFDVYIQFLAAKGQSFFLDALSKNKLNIGAVSPMFFAWSKCSR